MFILTILSAILLAGTQLSSGRVLEHGGAIGATAGIELAAQAVRSAAAAGFVHTKPGSTSFWLDNTPWYCAGTNAFFAAKIDMLGEAEVAELFKTHAEHGASAVRVFALEHEASNGIMPAIGKYNEEALRRLDQVVKSAGDNGVRLILTLSNFEPFLGGWEWWVNTVLGPGKPKELFLTDATVRGHFKDYVSTIMNRVNTYTGVPYNKDPTIMAWELGNEPHTSDSYESSHGLSPVGKLVCDWVAEMAPYFKSQATLQMITTGEEGYRSEGNNQEPNAWTNNGLKGVDFVCNVNVPAIDFATVHVYPDNWKISSGDYSWVGPNYIADRAKIAHAAGKPIIMEEFGLRKNLGYDKSREEVFTYLLDQANSNDYACTLVWHVTHKHMDSLDPFNGESYTFTYGQDGSEALVRQNALMKHKSGLGATEAKAEAVAAVPEEGSGTASASASTTVAASDANFATTATATATASAQGLGSLQQALQGVVTSVHHSAAVVAAPSDDCADTPPPGTTNTCAEQAGWGKCSESWLSGYCLKSCSKCGTTTGAAAASSAECTDAAPDGEYTCAQQASFGACDRPWMVAAGHCLKSCGKC